MTRLFRRAIFWGAVFVALAAAVVLVNQVLQLSEFAGRIDPTLGEAVFWGISIMLALSLLVPVLLILRFPNTDPARRDV